MTDSLALTLYQTAMILSLLASIFLLVLIWQRRKAPGAGAMLVLAAGTFIWTLGYLLEANSSTLGKQLFFTGIGYIGNMTVPVAWFLFALHYTGGNRIATGRGVWPFLIVPSSFIFLVWTNDLHHLMWDNEHLVTSGAFTVTAKTYGAFFWIALTHNYLMIAGGAIVLMRRLFTGTPLYTGQAISLVAAVIFPLAWNVIYVFRLIPLLHKDLTPVMFALSGLAITVGVLRFRLLAFVPFAHNFIVHQLKAGILVFDTENNLVEVNQAGLEILSADKSIIGKRFEFTAPLNLELKRLSVIGTGSTEIPLTVSGEERFYELQALPINDSRDRRIGWLAILNDITEKKKLQEQLIIQDRMASIGQLVSGVAHELNNPLTSVVGFSELALMKELPEDLRADLTIINSEAKRTAEIIRNLLTFARHKPQEKATIDISEPINAVLRLRSREQQQHNITVSVNLAANLPRISGNNSQLQQVFYNLVTNAEQAMLEAHGGGILNIRTEQSGAFIRISVADDGPGISRDNMTRIFNPFFTTKAVGKGTGLGLSISQGIVLEHGGKIWAESSEKGATFIVELPVLQTG